MIVERSDARGHGSGPQLNARALWEAVDAERRRRGRALPPSATGNPYPWSRISRETGISNPVLSKLEGGVTAPSVDTLVKLLVWLGTYDMRPFVGHSAKTSSPQEVPAAAP